MRTLVILIVLFAEATVAAGKKKATPLEGTWSSPRCGGRGYERRITFAADGTFTSEDRVSPCPKDVDCFWSGIVNRKGTYALKGARLELVAAKPEAKQGEPLPAFLTRSRDELVEHSGGTACAYRPFTRPALP